MAKASTGTASLFRSKPRRKRPGIHAKKKNAVNKRGKNYNKKYRGQGGKR